MPPFRSTAPYARPNWQNANYFSLSKFLTANIYILKALKKINCKKVLEFACCLRAMSVTRPSLHFCWLIGGTVGC